MTQIPPKKNRGGRGVRGGGGGGAAAAAALDQSRVQTELIQVSDNVEVSAEMVLTQISRQSHVDESPGVSPFVLAAKDRGKEEQGHEPQHHTADGDAKGGRFTTTDLASGIQRDTEFEEATGDCGNIGLIAELELSLTAQISALDISPFPLIGASLLGETRDTEVGAGGDSCLREGVVGSEGRRIWPREDPPAAERPTDAGGTCTCTCACTCKI